MANNKIRIRLKSFDHKILDNSAEKIIGAAKKSGEIYIDDYQLNLENLYKIREKVGIVFDHRTI